MASGLSLSEAERLSYEALFDVIGGELAMARPRCVTPALDTLQQALRLYRLRELLEKRALSRSPA
jgi:hypothetical protein